MRSPRDKFHDARRRPSLGAKAPSSKETLHAGEAGETLVEVLIALIVLALASVALITAFGTDISASAEHRSLANFDTVLASSIATTTSLFQQQPYDSVFTACNPLAFYQNSLEQNILNFNLPENYTASIEAVQFSDGNPDGTGFGPTCTSSTPTTPGNFSQPQLITLVVTDTVTNYSQTNSVLVTNLAPPQVTPGNGSTATQLIFATSPEGATVDSAFTTQPVLEVLDSSDKIVTSDLSAITLTLTTISGDAQGASLSSTCSGVETSGVVVYSGCSINEAANDYELIATEPSSGQQLIARSQEFPVTATALDTPTVSVSSSTLTAGALHLTFSAPLNAPPSETYSAKACTDHAMSANCVTFPNITPGNTGNELNGLVSGTSYFVQVTAAASANFAPSTSTPVGPTLATSQLVAPGTPSLTPGPVAGSLTVNFAGSPNAQSYTAEACPTTNFTSPSCITNTNFAPGGSFTGLSYTPGGAGATYYVEVSANAAPGYLASLPSPAVKSPPVESAVKTPTGLSATSSASQVGAIFASFAEPSGGVAPSSFTATVCPTAAVTSACLTVTNYSSGAQLTNLTPGSSYYVQMTAVSSTAGYASATTAFTTTPAVASVQLVSPANVTLGYGTTAGAMTVSFTASPQAPTGQIYGVQACTNGNCTNFAITSTSATLGLAVPTPGQVGASYNVQVTANGSTGYFVSAPSTQVSGPVESQVAAPGTPTVATGTVKQAIAVTKFTASTGTPPTGYTAVACTVDNQGTLSGCNAPQAIAATGGEITGLTSGARYYIQITADGPTGYLNNISGISVRTTAD
jgi:type II secretory pathway pseudopilin PulG